MIMILYCHGSICQWWPQRLEVSLVSSRTYCCSSGKSGILGRAVEFVHACTQGP